MRNCPPQKQRASIAAQLEDDLTGKRKTLWWKKARLRWRALERGCSNRTISDRTKKCTEFSISSHQNSWLWVTKSVRTSIMIHYIWQVCKEFFETSSGRWNLWDSGGSTLSPNQVHTDRQLKWTPDSTVGFSIDEVLDTICAYDSCTNYYDGAFIGFLSNLFNIHARKAQLNTIMGFMWTQ